LKRIAVLLVLTACAVAQNGDSPKKVSAEFAKAANLALVAIKNASEWKLQEEAINNAEAVAVSPEETAALASIKHLGGQRAMMEEIWRTCYTLAQAKFMDRNPGATSEQFQAGIKADKGVIESQKQLDNNDACNAAWRLALRNLDGTEPTVCKNATVTPGK
jgi:hypothetical protein